MNWRSAMNDVQNEVLWSYNSVVLKHSTQLQQNYNKVFTTAANEPTTNLQKPCSAMLYGKALHKFRVTR